jgi:GDP-L-fucose synthase
MRIYITGGRGFLGNTLFQALQGTGANVQALGRNDGDLGDLRTAERLLKDADVIVHLAADVGGLGYLRSCAGEAFHKNFRLGLNVVRAACSGRAKRIVMAGTPCAYSSDAELPLKEETLRFGVPSGDTGSYGYAKLASSIVSNHFCSSNGIDSVTVIPSNLYGPGDNYDSERGHVVAALLRKAMIAHSLGQDSFSVWGDGAATRDFVFVRDVAMAITKIVVSDKNHAGAVYNLGSGVETSIKELSKKVAAAVSDKIQPRFDADKPVGYNRRVMSIEHAQQSIGYLPEMSLERGLSETVSWLRKENLVSHWLKSDSKNPG